MEILAQLGINGSALIQFCIFVITITLLSRFVFLPYTKAVLERQVRTKGGEELATEIHQKAVDLRSEYEGAVRDLTHQISLIHSTKRSVALQEYDRIVQGAKSDAQTRIAQARKSIEAAYLDAQNQVQPEVQALSMMIATKVLGKK